MGLLLDAHVRTVPALCLAVACGLALLSPAAASELGLATTHTGPGLEAVGVGVDRWLSQALADSSPLDAGGSEALGIASARGITRVLLPEIAESEGSVEVQLVVADAAGEAVGRGVGNAALASLDTALADAFEALGKSLGSPLESMSPPPLGELSAVGRAVALERADRPLEAWRALEGRSSAIAEALRGELVKRARGTAGPPAERARLLAASGDAQAAWATLGSRVNLEVGKPRPNVELLLAAGEVQLARPNPGSALRFLRAAERAAPDSLEVQLAMARAWELQGDAKAAGEALRRAAAIDPDDPRPPAGLAELATEPAGKRARYLLEAGRAAARDREPERARDLWQRARALDPGLADQLARESGRLEAQLGRPAQALEAYRQVAATGAADAETWTGVGTAQAALGQNDAAEDSLRRALKLEPDHAPALSRLGVLLTESDRAAEAVPVLRRAHQLEPARDDTRLALARSLRHSGATSEAADVLTSDGTPESLPALRELADLQRASGDEAGARDTLARAVELRPFDPELRASYAEVLSAASGQSALARTGESANASAEAPADAESDAAPAPTGSSVEFEGLVQTFGIELSDPAATRLAVLSLREPSDARTWLRRLSRLREPHRGRVEAKLRAAVGSRFSAVEIDENQLGSLGQVVSTLYDFEAASSRSAETIARVNTVLGTDGILVTRLIAHPEDHASLGCDPGSFALQSRLLLGGEARYVNLLAAHGCVPEGLDRFGRWNPLSFAGLLVLAMLLVYPLIRGWGTIVVRTYLPDKTKGFFSIFITGGPNQVRKELVDKKTGREKLVARRSLDPLRRFRKHMAGREETFRLIPARRREYVVTVGGPLLDASGEKIIGHFLEEQIARVRRRGVTALDFDFRPRECAVEVKVNFQGEPAEDARVSVAGDPSSMRYARDGQAFLYLGMGEHVIRMVNKHSAAEFRVLVESYEKAVPLHVDLAECELLFRDCPAATEPFLIGDLASAVDALEAAGQEDAARRVRAELLEARGMAGDAARELEAAGRLGEAADLKAADSDHAGSAELLEQAGEDAKAAEAYRSAGRWEEAAACYERVYDYGNALECWRELGDEGRELELLELLGEYFEAAELARSRGEPERAIQQLQQVDQRHPQFRHACRLIAEIVAEQGDYDLAISKFEESFSEVGTEGAALDALESYAQVLESAERREQALSIWEEIRRRDVSRHDVGTRIKALRSQLESVTEALATPADEATTGEIRYELLDELGRGGMGVVYRARDKRLGRIVALKRLPDNMRQHPTAVELFEREARAAAALNHPNIVTLFDAGQEAGHYFITMELLEGKPVNEILARHGHLSPRDTARIGIQVAAGLHYAHAQRIVHRDIKTSNLFFTKDQIVKIMDFGIAKSMEEVRRSTTVVGGTPYYMAPEQARGEGVDHRADLYALGVTLFQICTGELPFGDGDVTYQHAHSPPPDPREVELGIPEPLAALILRLLAKEPDERPANAAEVAEVLRGVLA